MTDSILMPSFARSPYPFFFIASFIVAFAVVCIILKREKISSQITALTCLLVFFMTLFGAVSFGIIRSGFVKNIFNAGFSSLGGAIGLLLASFIMGLIYPEGKSALMRAFTLMLPLMYGISKLGCFSIGCCHGIPYTGFFAVKYDNYLVQTESVFPVQMAESLVFIIIFVIGVAAYRKRRDILVPLVLFLCSIGKFSLDFLREEHMGKVLSVNQIICIIFLIIALILYIISKVKKGEGHNGTGTD